MGITQKCMKCGIKKSGTTNGAVEQGEYPWYALIRATQEVGGSTPPISDHNKFLCAGTLINSKWVVSSATCLHEWETSSSAATERVASHLKVVLGAHTLQASAMSSYANDYSVDRIVVPTNYGKSTTWALKEVDFLGDIGLLRLATHADISKYTPACLPSDTQDFFGKFAVITGFSLPDWTSDNAAAATSQPAEVDQVLIVTEDICDRLYDGATGYTDGDIDDKLICAVAKNTKDTCNADEGGPLVVDNGHGQYTLVGVLNSQSDCGDSSASGSNNPPLGPNRAHSTPGGLPLVYAKVSKHVHWITQAMEANKNGE